VVDEKRMGDLRRESGGGDEEMMGDLPWESCGE